MSYETDSKAILPVTVLFSDGNEFILKCPHCGSNRGIENETGSLDYVKGEQYQDNMCKGWFEVSQDAKLVTNLAEVESQPCELDSLYDCDCDGDCDCEDE
ncbi:hypothetical protein LMH73_009365 [Vibrio splendidus]|nr:hypothetical protein [Vibrio splendidus]MCC4881866.1 hypothetical protein [Vibrio splendidus]